MEDERQEAANRMSQEMISIVRDKDVAAIAGAFAAAITAVGLSAPDIEEALSFVDTIYFAAKKVMHETWNEPGRQSGRVPH